MKQCAITLEPEMTAEEHRLLIEVLRSDHGTGLHLEIGTAAGGTLVRMLQAFTPHNRPRFSVVDPMRYFPEQFDAVRRNLQQHGFDPDRVDFRIGTSASTFPNAVTARDSFDFLLIDACHKLRAVMSDLKWARLLNVGGLICLHDYSPRFPGVVWAVDRFLRRNANYERVGLAGSLLALRKTAVSQRPEVTRADELFALIWSLPLMLGRRWQKLFIPKQNTKPVSRIGNQSPARAGTDEQRPSRAA
jgi:predicted O-methyltransferase YrrM